MTNSLNQFVHSWYNGIMLVIKWQFKDDDIFGNSSDKHKLMKDSYEDNNIAYYM